MYISISTYMSIFLSQPKNPACQECEDVAAWHCPACEGSMAVTRNSADSSGVPRVGLLLRNLQLSYHIGSIYIYIFGK